MDDFTKAVEDGLKLAKRICNTNDRYTPPRLAEMERLPLATLRPTAPMAYAVIYDPAMVDNPDLPSYQPHVYGRMDPPALIPLQMNEIAAEVECYLDTAFVTVRGSWRVHCVMGSRSCDCRVVVPMGEQGSMLGVEVDVSKRLYSTQVVKIEENQNIEKTSKNEGGLLEAHMFFLTIPQVDGGSILSFKITWCQKLLYDDDQFSIGIPFNFPEYVNPHGKLISKKEMIVLNVNTGTGKEVLCKTTSHALKETRRQLGTLSYLYKAEVITWSTADIHFSYTVYSSDIFGGVLLQSPSVHDFDQREMFCLYLYPGNSQHRKVLRKEVVFVVDISESMRGKPLENSINALCAALSDLAPQDSFSIIAFNEETCTFSSSLELATEEMVENATHWISKNCVAWGGTNILRPLNEAMDMLSKSRDSVPHIFLITDGAVEDERNVCCTMRTYMTSGRPIAPRISTFGIGSYCNHYFLRMLANIGRGYYDAAFDADSIEVRMKRFYRRALSPMFVNITVDIPDHLDAYEVYPSHFPDLLFGMPLIISGRYHGSFPETLKAKGITEDMTNSEIDLKVQKTKDIPLDKVFAKQQIDLLTAQAWFSESKFFEEKVIKLSIQNGIVSEYTHMILLQSVMQKLASEQEVKKMDFQKHVGPKDHKQTLVPGLSVGFGNVTATSQNLPSGFGQVKIPESSAVLIAAVSCCGSLADCCCCMCFIKVCSKMNDQCVVVMAQICTALSFLACFECCTEVCCDGSD